MSRLARGAVCVALAGASLSACGDKPKRAEKLGSTTLAGTTLPPARVLLSPDAIEREPTDSPRQLLLKEWSSRQWQSWPEAIGYYDQDFLEYVGVGRVISALRSQATYFRSVRIEIRSVSAEGPSRTVRYFLVDANGVTAPHSITYEKRGGSWFIVYDDYLDEALRLWAQTRKQGEVNPQAKVPGKAAVTAGNDASELQAAFNATERARATADEADRDLDRSSGD